MVKSIMQAISSKAYSNTLAESINERNWNGGPERWRQQASEIPSAVTKNWINGRRMAERLACFPRPSPPPPPFWFDEMESLPPLFIVMAFNFLAQDKSNRPTMGTNLVIISPSNFVSPHLLVHSVGEQSGTCPLLSRVKRSVVMTWEKCFQAHGLFLLLPALSPNYTQTTR